MLFSLCLWMNPRNKETVSRTRSLILYAPHSPKVSKIHPPPPPVFLLSWKWTGPKKPSQDSNNHKKQNGQHEETNTLQSISTTPQLAHSLRSCNIFPTFSQPSNQGPSTGAAKEPKRYGRLGMRRHKGRRVTKGKPHWLALWTFENPHGQINRAAKKVLFWRSFFSILTLIPCVLLFFVADWVEKSRHSTQEISEISGCAAQEWFMIPPIVLPYFLMFVSSCGDESLMWWETLQIRTNPKKTENNRKTTLEPLGHD